MDDFIVFAIILALGAVFYGIHEWSRVTLLKSQMRMGDGVATVITKVIGEVGECVRSEQARQELCKRRLVDCVSGQTGRESAVNSK